MSSETIRLFIALTLPTAMQQHCVRLISTLKNDITTGVRWEVGDKIHITLRFLGETPSTSLPSLTESLNSLAQAHAPIMLHLAGLGAFPNWRSPSVLWLGIVPNAALNQLQSDLEQRLAGAGILKDKRKFHPHLTLGRVNRNCTPEVIRQIQQACQQINLPPFSDFQAPHVVLFQSTLQRNGAIHHALHTIDLNESTP
ncbi:MAG TPA: RNA 2',3'-cyclic phosphodiesterase [Chloroflexi bacterium]|nr:RNA 2',3'-cyclic phosphodiesterase [Chloroflexota bacterium]